MTIGATSGKEPDHIADEDLRTPEQLRGDMKRIADAALTNSERASVQGVVTEMEVLKLRMAELGEQIQATFNLIITIQGQFQQFQQQRVIELQSRGGGSTTPEDMEDGA